MKKIYILFTLIAFTVSACTFNVEVLTPAPSVPTDVLATQTVASPPLTSASATAESLSVTPAQDQTALPGQPAPSFFNARFASDPNNEFRQSSFPVRAPQIFGIWDYENMRAGLLVRREWYLDGKLWLAREEPWDFTKYGVNGMIRDISIYDFDTGLDSGVYQLRLYIDNIQQPIGSTATSPIQTWANFEIRSGESAQGSASPNFQWTSTILGEKRIVIRDTNGTPTELYTGREIAYLVWLPDSRHLLFVDRDRSQQQTGTSIGIRDDLWIAEIVSGETHLLYRNNAVFQGRGGLIVSSDGRYIAGIEGSGFGDACVVDSRLIFFELSSDFQNVRSIKQEQFSGIPVAPDGIVYPVEEGTWQSGTQYLVTLNGTCGIDQNLLGPYLFDVSNLSAVKN